jgi:hypothetical protein
MLNARKWDEKDGRAIGFGEFVIGDSAVRCGVSRTVLTAR